MKAYVHDAQQRAEAMKAGRPLRLEFRGGATTILKPNGQQVLEKRFPKGKAARKMAKKIRREIRERVNALSPQERVALAKQIAAVAVPKGGSL